MKAFLKSRLALMLGLTMTFWTGCSEKDTSSALGPEEAAIQEVILEDADELFGSEIMGEETPSQISKTVEGNEIVLSKSADLVDTVKGYGRKVRIRRDGFVVTFNEDSTTAEATITYKLTGEFIVLAKNAGSENVIVIRKPLEHTMQRKVQFARNAPDALRRWRVTAVSMGFGISKDGTLSLGSVSWIINGPSGLQTTTTSDPTNTFFNRTNLPHIQQGDTVRIVVNITNADPEDAPFGTIHRGRNRVMTGREKVRFVPIGNNNYATSWIVRNDDFEGVHIGVIDFFTTSSVKDTEAPYNSLAITVPYIKGAQLPEDDGN